MDPDHATPAQAAVELVIQTATSLVLHRRAPREAVTLLATQAPHARALAPSLETTDPKRAAAYAEILTSLASDLRDGLGRCDDPRDQRAVVEDLERVVHALTT